ncbi:hypothetical protein KY285_023985 [Solanum tuberosum]|nr:hypothetical protein KY289_024335 [Solanum tuberosum]KAH0676184.1 hypothetical protein KY285_023985 [Solanum tuberosum]
MWLNNCHKNIGRARRQVHQLAEQAFYVIKSHHYVNDTEVAEQARDIVPHLSKVIASMTTNIETAVNQVDTPVDLTTKESATVKENRTLRNVMAQLCQAWANGQEPPTSIPGFPQITTTMGRPFHTTIKIEEMVKRGLKTGWIVSHEAIKATTQSIQGGSELGTRGAQRKSDCPYPPI